MKKSSLFGSLLVLFSTFVICSPARADVGIILYESKGADARRTGTGHIALISTQLCPDGIKAVRICRAGEQPGAVLTRYANVASTYDGSIFVVPIRDHFTATSEPDLVPTLSSGGTLEAMQLEYWRLHLKPYFPPISQEQYQQMKEKLDRFDAGRTFRRALTMEYLIALLGPHKKRYPTEPIARIHPVTGELIPDGRWRESIGVQHMRSSIIVTVHTTPEQEQRLIAVAADATPRPFNAMTDNCSDFVSRGLVAVFGDAGLHMRPRALHVADAWITSPIAVATDFIGYAKRQKVPMDVELMPMLAGTRRPTAAITSISRGALVPDASQGKMAFSMKVYFNTLNPLLGLLAFTADKASRLVDLPDLVHERGSPELSRLANAAPVDKTELQREQVKVFGTASCWKAKQQEFARLEAQSAELGLISPAEKSLLLKPAQPFLLPRLYERTAAAQGNEGILMSGIEQCTLPGCGMGMVSSFFPHDAGIESAADSVPPGFVASRPEVRAMAESGERKKQLVAFRVMTSVVNYDLSSSSITRRTSASFDADWQLYLDVARGNGLHIADKDAAAEPIAACAVREFEAAPGKVQDAYQQDRSVTQKLVREGRGLLHGANR